MRTATLLQIALALLIAIASEAQESGTDDPFDFDLTEVAAPTAWQLNGFLEMRSQRFRDDSEQETEFLSNRAYLDLELKWTGDKWRAFISGFSGYDPAAENFRHPERSEIREVYVQRDGGGWSLTAGKVRLAWGIADGVSTIDLINAIVLRDPIGNARTPSRRPTWLLRAEKTTAIGAFEAVWMPRGRDRKLPEFGNPWEPQLLNDLRVGAAAGFFDLDLQDPHEDEYGFRYRHFGQGFDWGAAVFDGTTDAPVVLEESAGRVTLRPGEIRTWNLNGAFGLARSTLRGEASFTTDAPLGEAAADRTQLVVGWDRTFFTSFYVNVQLFHDRYAGLFEDNGVTFAITEMFFGDAVTAGVRGQASRFDQYAGEVFVDYQWTDAFRIGVKSSWFGGEPGSGLGDFRDNDYAELSVRWSF